MASSDFWQKLSTSLASSAESEVTVAAGHTRTALGTTKMWMAIDALTVCAAAVVTTLYKLHTTPMEGARNFWHGTLIHGRSTGILLALLCGFIFVLIVTSRRLHLYTPTHMTNFLHEQRMSAQACLTSGLLLTGALYLVQAEDIPRVIVLGTVLLVTIAVGLRRLIYRILLYRRFDRGLDTRNVLIVGTGPEAQALRHHLEKIRHLGYTFKGFIELPSPEPQQEVASDGI